MKKILAIRACVLGILLLFTICLTISSLHVIFPRHSTVPKIIVTSIPPPKKGEAVPITYSPPVRLEVAKLSISALVAAVGLTQDNAMDIDKDISKTAWYKLGPKPGEKGSAVIAGHYGWINGQGSVFNDLHTLQPGDKITVYDEKGLAINFIVREIRKYSLDADTTEVFRSIDNKAHLNLITCEGSWDRSRQTYSDRLVVFSDLEI